MNIGSVHIRFHFLWCGDVGHCNTFLKFKCTACVIRFILEEGLICGKV